MRPNDDLDVMQQLDAACAQLPIPAGWCIVDLRWRPTPAGGSSCHVKLMRGIVVVQVWYLRDGSKGAWYSPNSREGGHLTLAEAVEVALLWQAEAQERHIASINQRHAQNLAESSQLMQAIRRLQEDQRRLRRAREAEAKRALEALAVRAKGEAGAD